jgi:hypothetical protein
MAWRYFGRRSGLAEVFEIYRSDVTGRRIGLQDVLNMERLREDGSWQRDTTDRALYNEMLSGWFDDDDELGEDEVNRLLQQWKSRSWPGRP